MILADHVEHLKILADDDPRYAEMKFSTAAYHKESATTAKRVIRFDHKNLFPGAPGLRFNSSIIASGDGYLFAWRTGWEGSQVYAGRLDAAFQPVGEAKMLKLRMRKAAGFGREDPRWFRLNGKLHLMYIGVAGSLGPTNVCFARINEETLETEDRFHPAIPRRQSWEKNHSYYDVDGVAHAVYTIVPHRIIRVEGRKASFVAETPTVIEWLGGRICGGASPVLVGDEWYHFFHGSTEWNGRRRYNMGCYTFENRHPWKVTRFTPHPLDEADITQPHDNHCDVLFPGGAVLAGDEWIIAQGTHDRWSELRFYDRAWVETQLEPVQ